MLFFAKDPIGRRSLMGWCVKVNDCTVSSKPKMMPTVSLSVVQSERAAATLEKFTAEFCGTDEYNTTG